MKTLTKTFGLSLLFTAIILVSTLQITKADCLHNNCANKAASIADTTESVSASDDEFDFDFSDPFFFSDKVVVNVYNYQDELIYSKSFSKDEAKQDTELKAILKKSEFLLSIDNQHYYYTRK